MFHNPAPIVAEDPASHCDDARPSEVAAMSPRTLRFLDAETEAAFQAHRRPIVTEMVRSVLFFASVVIMFGAVIDVTEFDLLTAEELVGERAVIALGMVSAALIIRAEVIQRRLIAFLTMGAVGANLIWITAAMELGPRIAEYTGVLPIMMLLTFLVTGLSFRRALPIAALSATVYLPTLLYEVPDPIPPMVYLVVGGLFAGYAAYAAERARREAWARDEALRREKARAERLLLNVLPPSIAARMKDGEAPIADRYEDAGVLFADLVGFTRMSAAMAPERLVALLDEIFTRFDRIAEQHDLEKIKTIGDCYMLVGGLPREREGCVNRLAEAALEMRGALASIALRHGMDVDIRIGLHAGPVVAGVIGRAKFVYDLWGDTVNVASRLEGAAPIGGVLISEAFRDQLNEGFLTTDRGEIDLKGKGPTRAHILLGQAIA